jgi:hypothetical protein
MKAPVLPPAPSPPDHRSGRFSRPYADAAPESVEATPARIQAAGRQTVLIAVAMVLVTVLACGGAPTACIYVAGHVVARTAWNWEALALSVAPLPALLWPAMRLLAWLQRRQCEIAGTIPRRHRSAWLKAQCAERGRGTPTMLDKITCSALLLTWVLAVVWFFTAADPGVPPGP